MKKKLGLFGLLCLCSLGVATTTALTVSHYAQENAIVAYAEGEETETETEQEVVAEETSKKDEVNAILEKWFSPQMIATYISYASFIGVILGLAVKLAQLKKTNNLTLKDVSEEVQKKLAGVVSEEVAKKFDAMLPSILNTQEKTNQIMSIFAKILALSQENTPESRVAILDLIEQLGAVSKEVIDNAKEVIDTGVKLAEQAKEELDQKIDEIVDSYDGTSI